MGTTEIIKETLQLISSTSLYITDLEVTKVIGQEIIKESVKKFYNWIFDKFKKNKKENDLTAYLQNTQNLKLEGKIESTLETIINNESEKKELIELINAIRPVFMNQNNTQINQSGNGTIISGNSINGDMVLGHKNIYQK